MLFIIKAAVTIQMWRMNSSTQTSLFHISHLVRLYGFHICIFLFMSTLSSIITLKCSPGLNPAIKLTGVTLIVRHRHSSDHKCCTTYCCFKSQANLPLHPPLSGAFHSDLVSICNKKTSRESSASAYNRLPFCVLHFFFHLFSCCSDWLLI